MSCSLTTNPSGLSTCDSRVNHLTIFKLRLPRNCKDSDVCTLCEYPSLAMCVQSKMKEKTLHHYGIEPPIISWSLVTVNKEIAFCLTAN